MKFACLVKAEAENEILKKEFKVAKQQGEVRLGDVDLFYRYFIKVRFVPYEEIAKIYLREESGESGEFLLKEFYLMLETKDGTLHKLRMEREQNARAVLDYLGENHKHISIGYYRNIEDRDFPKR